MSKQNMPRNREPKQILSRNCGTVAIMRAEVTAMSMEDIFQAGKQTF